MVVAAVLMGLTALAATLIPRNGGLGRDPAPTPTAIPPAAPAAPSPTTTPGAAAPPEASPGTGAATAGSLDPIEKTIDAEGDPEKQRIVAREGQLVRVVVTGDVLDTVNLDDLTNFETIIPESPARFELLADAPGVHPITLVDAGRTIGQLEIRPAG